LAGPRGFVVGEALQCVTPPGRGAALQRGLDRLLMPAGFHEVADQLPVDPGVLRDAPESLLQIGDQLRPRGPDLFALDRNPPVDSVAVVRKTEAADAFIPSATARRSALGEIAPPDPLEISLPGANRRK